MGTKKAGPVSRVQEVGCEEIRELGHRLVLAGIVRGRQPMPWRRLAFLVLSYVSLDLSSPFVPGAFSFNPDDCVEGVRQASSHRAARLNQANTTPPANLTPARLVEPPRSLDRHRTSQNTENWLIDIKRAHPP